MRSPLPLTALLAIVGCEQTSAEPTRGGVAELSCSDGVDDDSDGLIDCEDGDCVTSCTERDCAGDADADGDGLYGCADEDCWGTEACLEAATLPAGTLVSSRVLGGWMLLGRELERTRGTRHSHTEFRDWIQAGDLWGTVQLQRPSTTVTTTCSWSMETFSWSLSGTDAWTTGRWDSHFTEDLHRAGFNISDGCPLRSQGFLPDQMAVETSAATGNGLGWYQGRATWSFTDYSYSYVSFDEFVAYTTSWSVPSLETGDTFTTVVP